MSDNGQEKQVLFEIKQLCKSFGPTKVLDHIDATIRQGEVVVIVGRFSCPLSLIDTHPPFQSADQS